MAHTDEGAAAQQVVELPEEATANGLIYLYPFGQVARPDAVRFPVLTLSGSWVHVRLPVGFEVLRLTRSILLHSRTEVVAWQAVARGEALWAFADFPDLELRDLVELDGAKLAFYDMGLKEPDGPAHLTLWQGTSFDAYSHNFQSMQHAVAFVATFRLRDQGEGPFIDTMGWDIDDEDLTATVASPGDHRGDLVLDIRPVALHTDWRPRWPGTEGAGGEFYLLHDEIEEGFQMFSDSAIATLAPATTHTRVSSLASSQSDYLAGLRVEWRAPNSESL